MLCSEDIKASVIFSIVIKVLSGTRAYSVYSRVYKIENKRIELTSKQLTYVISYS